MDTVSVEISSGYGAMGSWRFMVNHATLPGRFSGQRFAIHVTDNGVTRVSRCTAYQHDTEVIISVKGFKRAMVALSKYLNAVIDVYVSPWSNSARARAMRGTYGTYTPPPPPPVPTAYDVAMLRDAHAERRARMRGLDTGTTFGYCQHNGCGNVAASMSHDAEGRPIAACKRHVSIDVEALNRAIETVRTNGRVFVAESHNFGGRDVFARAANDGFLILIKDGGMTRWEMPPLPGGEAVSAFSIGSKRKRSSARNRRYRKGA